MSQAEILHSDLTPTLDRTVLQLLLKLASPTESANSALIGHMNGTAQTNTNVPLVPQVSLVIVCHGSDDAARAAFGIQADIQQTLSFSTQKLTNPLGDAYVVAEQGMAIAWVRANVSVTVHSANPHAPVDSATLINMARLIDAHLATAVVDEVTVSRGSVPLASPAPTQVFKGDSFTMQVAGVETPDRPNATMAGIDEVSDRGKVVAFVSDPLAVVCTGPSDAEGKLRFVAFEAGTVVITLLRPHAKTLMPGVKRLVVEVVDR
jgi:hypothetical protein